jgi:uncharacterized membrane protein HdeD (DUF308 family)
MRLRFLIVVLAMIALVAGCAHIMQAFETHSYTGWPYTGETRHISSTQPAR